MSASAAGSAARSMKRSQRVTSRSSVTGSPRYPHRARHSVRWIPASATMAWRPMSARRVALSSPTQPDPPPMPITSPPCSCSTTKYGLPNQTRSSGPPYHRTRQCGTSPPSRACRAVTWRSMSAVPSQRTFGGGRRRNQRSVPPRWVTANPYAKPAWPGIVTTSDTATSGSSYFAAQNVARRSDKTSSSTARS